MNYKTPKNPNPGSDPENLHTCIFEVAACLCKKEGSRKACLQPKRRLVVEAEEDESKPRFGAEYALEAARSFVIAPCSGAYSIRLKQFHIMGRDELCPEWCKSYENGLGRS